MRLIEWPGAKARISARRCSGARANSALGYRGPEKSSNSRERASNFTHGPAAGPRTPIINGAGFGINQGRASASRTRGYSRALLALCRWVGAERWGEVLGEAVSVVVVVDIILCWGKRFLDLWMGTLVEN